ncbi:MAG: IS1182 family transposase [Sedimentisphaerales bacterium]|nr:IS1182 family transposase [Sedimentisphaerales bacterium]
MAGFRKPEIPREQMVLWSQKLDDSLPIDHPVRHLTYLLESEPFAARFREWASDYVLLEGKPPYHPRDLSGLYIYGMLNRIRSSRQLEAATHNRLDVIWLMSGQHPDHSTIAAFVTAHGQKLRKLFRDTVEVGLRAGLVKLEHVAIDGTKIEADAGKGSVHREATMASQLATVDQKIEALETEWAQNEAREASLFGPEVPWAPTGGGSAKEQLARLKAQQKRLKEALASMARRREENEVGRAPKPIASVTDPDSRVMPDKEGKSKPNDNAQIAADAQTGMVTAHDVNDRTEDSGQMTPLLGQVEENCGSLPEEASADSQYNTGPELAALEQMEVEGCLPDNGQPSDADRAETAATRALAAVRSGATLTDEQWEALPKDGKGRVTKEAFRYDDEANVYRCPMGEVLGFLQKRKDQKRWGTADRMQYGGCPACSHCPRAGMCCSNPSQGRIVSRDQYEGHRERMRERMNTEEGRSRYRLRGPTVESRFGYIKRGLGIRRFMRRGRSGVRTEWSLICTVVNVSILLAHWAEVQKTL